MGGEGGVGLKLIGLVGGVTWLSTLDYYRTLNELVAARLGGLHSGKIALFSLDFAEVAEAQERGRWDTVGDLVAGAARALREAGAELLLLAANTLHLVAGRAVAASGLPLLHVVDPTGREAVRRGYRSVGLLGTRFTLEKPFYRERLEREFGLTVLVPEEEDKRELHRVIFEELVRERLLETSRRAVVNIIDRLGAKGAEAVLLACTELPHLVGQAETPVPLLDPLALHCREAVDFALASGPGPR